jgi:hypothetical protein
MPWLYLLLAVAALAIAFKTTSVAVLVICLLAALGFALAWLMGALARRIEDRTGSPAMMIDPVELQRLREQAEARRAAALADAGAQAAQDPARPG